MSYDRPDTTAFQLAHASVCSLIDRFEKYARDTYLLSGYSEAAARKDFIDPLLKASGWDVAHEREHNPYEQPYFAVQTRKQELIEQRLADIECVQAREKLTTSQKALSGVMFERGVDSHGFGRIVSMGDAALFGGNSTQDMKKRMQVPDGRPLADFLPTLAIKAKDFANEVTSTQIKEDERRVRPRWRWIIANTRSDWRTERIRVGSVEVRPSRADNCSC